MKPERITWAWLHDTADAEVKRTTARLPKPVLERIRDIPVTLEPVPSRALVRDGVDPELMGLFVGNSLEESEPAPVALQIFLFLRNIWDEAGSDPARYREEVRRTFLHEIGHYLGLDEDGLALRDLD